MTLPRFLDCAFTLLFDEYQRLGHDLISAQEKLGEWGPKVKRPEKKAEANLAAKNTAALQELKNMMAGVRKA